MLNDNGIKESAAFLVTNASGRHINLLNDNEQQQPQQPQQPVLFAAPSPPSSELSDEINNNSNDSPFRISPPVNTTSSLTAAEEAPTSNSNSSKRKYHCTEPGCTKSFTTSGHLARHNRIHTGEKNFPCLFPGCQSRFSRQDNMMQHYRTHMSPKSRRTTQQKRVISEDLHPRPRLHAHQRIRSDPYRVERPLTIDQHLNNYRRSLLSHPSSIKYNMPAPLGSVAQSHMQKQQQKTNYPVAPAAINSDGVWAVQPVAQFQEATTTEQEEAEDMEEEQEYSEGTHTPLQQQQSEAYTPSPIQATAPRTTTPEILFYQHRPLTFTAGLVKSNLPFTLLHPTRVPITPSPPARQELNHFDFTTTTADTPSLSSSSTSSSSIPTLAAVDNTSNTNNSPSSNTSSSQAGLLQLAHIVSTFG